MIENLLKYKWRLFWCFFIVLAALFVFMAVFFRDQSWIGSVLQTFGTVIAIYPTILLAYQSKAESERLNRLHLDHLQKLNQDEITEMRNLFQKQIDTLTNSTNEQIKAIQDATRKQIENYTEQTNKLVEKLTDNSVLLAELLKRELEDALDQAESNLNKANAKYEDLQGFKLLRTKEEREVQLQQQAGFIERMKKWIDYLQGKYKMIKNYLGE